MALTVGRKTPCLPASEASRDMIQYPIAASTTIFVGGMVGVNATGFLVPMTAATGLKCVGVAWLESGQIPPVDGKFDNSTGADGAFYINVRRGIQFFANSTTDPVVVGDLQGVVYAQDDYTVQHTSGTNSPAGILIRVVTGTAPGDKNYGPGCWVDVGVPIIPSVATAVIAGVTITAPTGVGQVLTSTSTTAAHFV